MPIVGTKAAASSQGFGEFAQASTVATYIEDVFSTYLYAGTSATNQIVNGIDLAGNGGMVWTKSRTQAGADPVTYDTARGAGYLLKTDQTVAQIYSAISLASFNSDGMTFGADTAQGYSNYAPYGNYVSWTFRKQPKFFDVVTVNHTSGTATNIDLSGLGTVGCVILKRYSASDADGWFVWHRSLTAGNNLRLNTTAAQSSAKAYLSVSGTTATISGSVSTASYVIYAFAHNAGGFGLTGTDNVISCGSYTTNGSGTATVSLGYEPQWLLVKRTNTTANWYVVDTMRGATVDFDNAILYPNLSDAEVNNGAGFGIISPTATGFNATGGASNTYIYIAIRRGPMKTPTTGTSVFKPVVSIGSGTPAVITGFVTDSSISTYLTQGYGNSNRHFWGSRLTGPNCLETSSTAAEQNPATSGFDGFDWDFNNGFGATGDITSNYITHDFRRAPGFFDQVCYTGTGSAGAKNHNLGVVPEWIITKSRSQAGEQWWVYSSALGAGKYMLLSSNDASGSDTRYINATPTATTFTINSGDYAVNASGVTYVSYLFASCPGVSKVTNFTGNGSTQTINCGFTGGARFVMIKATSTTGNWLVFDTARGMTTSTDPWLALNSTAAESATTGACTTVSSGFAVDESKLTGVNTNGVSYIALAIA